MKQIYVFDPGKLTGMAVINYTEESQEATLIDSGELTVEEFWDFLNETEALIEDRLLTGTQMEIVYEKFFITPETGKKNDTDYSLRLIGALQYVANKHGLPTYSYSPSDAKNFVDNKRLKNVGLWHVGGEGHAKDALRHAVLHLVKNRNWRPEGLLV